MTLLGPELAAKDPCKVGLRSLHQKVSSPQEGKRDFCFDLDVQVLISMGKKINLATLQSWFEVASATKIFNAKRQDRTHPLGKKINPLGKKFNLATLRSWLEVAPASNS